jgi:hypothetical protein
MIGFGYWKITIKKGVSKYFGEGRGTGMVENGKTGPVLVAI